MTRHPFDELVEVMARLRGPGGCPWDREQTHRSLRPYLIEEAYEAAEAAQAGDDRHLAEELGDVLLQVVFHAQIARERGAFSIEDVVRGLTEKLVRRHPHVFGDVRVAGAGEVVRNWEAIKAAEAAARGESPGPRRLLEGVGKGQPALTRARKVQEKAAEVGFDWKDITGPLAKVSEEVAEIERARLRGRSEEIEAEVGDLLFAAVNVARKLGVDPELALSEAIRRFERRFGYIEDRAAASGRALPEMSLEEMDTLWEEGKRAEK